MACSPPPPLTFSYQTVKRGRSTHTYFADLYLPPQSDGGDTAGAPHTPMVVYFHSGGLTAGSRKLNSWFPFWLIGKYMNVRTQAILLRTNINLERIGVVGESAGGYLALLSATQVQPPPACLGILYGMGGDFLTDHYVLIKTSRFSFWIPYLDDPSPFAVLDDTPEDGPVVSESSTEDGDPRVSYFTWLVQQATFLDALTGQPGLGKELSALAYPKRVLRIKGSDVAPLFPQCNINESTPPTYLIHGQADTAVLVEESRRTIEALEQNSVAHCIDELPGVEHGFDWGPSKYPRHPSLTRLILGVRGLGG
ncbi:hypothetical protein V866_006915 [Kwoniella sp. B9012]